MGEQRHYRRPSQHKRRPPQTVMPCGSEDTPERQSEHRAETEKKPPRQPRKRLVQKPTPKSRQNPPEQWAKWRGQALDSAKQCAKRGAKRAERDHRRFSFFVFQNRFSHLFRSCTVAFFSIDKSAVFDSCFRRLPMEFFWNRFRIRSVKKAFPPFFLKIRFHGLQIGQSVDRAPR